MKKTNKKFKKLKFNKKIIIISIIIFLLVSSVMIFSTQIIKKVQIKKIEDKPLIECDIKERIDFLNYKVVIKITNLDGIETVKYLSHKTNKEIQLNSNGKKVIALDYQVKDGEDYEFKIKINGKEEQTEIFHFEIPRKKTNYSLVGGTYVQEPDLSGFVKQNTRYLYMDNEGDLVPGNWITGEKPNNWYDYEKQKWANIYVENNGVDSYYVWIPRFVYKVDTENVVSGNERMDVKFINTFNEYIDGKTGEKIEWEQLLEQGYKLPEAFEWENSKDEPLILPGYWMSKYQLTELETYNIDYMLTATKNNFDVKYFTNNVSSTATRYTYAINGEVVHQSSSLSDYSFTKLNSGEINYINVTALNSKGCIVGSMTKKFEPTETNPPDLTGFDEDTTFYVYWDEAGNEHNEIPISQKPPEDWYSYSYSQWANIVTRENGLESYYVWIPRYQYILDQTTQRSDVQFILGTGTDTIPGYKIPEAFTWGDNGEVQLKGYWMSKYQLSTEETNARVTAGISAGSSLIRIGDITGTALTTTDEEGNTINVPIKYEYYIDGELKHEGTSSTEKYVYTGLNENTQYTVNIIARNSSTNAYIGAITKKIETIKPYEPDLTGFDKDTTFYVIFNEDGTEKERISIKEKIPSNWYDYSNRIWANIVTTANDIESYFVWIPRYEYRIDSNKTVESLDNKRTEVNFVTIDVTNENGKTTTGYQVPEAFSWGDNGEVQIKGYWMSKYQLSE